MTNIPIRELRRHGGDLVERERRGELLTITRAGKPVAQLVSLPRSPASLDLLRRRWAALPEIDPVDLRRELDEPLDPAL